MNRPLPDPALPSRPSRREFLRQSGLAALTSVAAAAVARAAATPPALVGSNAYGWGQYAKRDKKAHDLTATMAAVRELGYDYLEATMDPARPDEVGEMANQMRARGLQPVSLYCGPRLHEAGAAATVVGQVLAAARVARANGFQSLTCNPAPIGRAKTEAELATQAAALRDLGRGLKEIGIRLGLHHHLPEMAQQAREFHQNFRQTNPAEVGFCYDVHWVWKGGVPPAEALPAYGNRIVSWHLRQSRDGIWWEDLDTGDIDYGAIARYATEHRLPRLFTVELALEPKTLITRDGIENHRRSRTFVRTVFGA
ncbi:MAG: sugar phosphate isomerase/epimerase [Verrucomicrobia bacterium]|nr:sugar phosphate isomerase/epimerase [Verrucomicrobiota bacterium]